MPSNPALGGVTKHRDSFLSSIAYNVRLGGKQAAYLTVNFYQVKAGKSQDWLNFFNAFSKPVLDQLLSDGTILGYGADEQNFHTEIPGGRSMWILYPDSAALDKTDAAFDAARDKYSAEIGKAVSASYSELVEWGAHRDELTRIISYTHK